MNLEPFQLVIDELHCRKENVIVISVPKSLCLSRQTSLKCLLKAAGPTLQQECSEKYPHGLPRGHPFVVTTAGRLSAKEVYHVGLQGWAYISEEEFAEVIRRCLDTADKKGHSSIALPALGIRHNYPRDVIARCFRRVTSEFTPNAVSLKKISLVIPDYDRKTIQAFRWILSFPLSQISVDGELASCLEREIRIVLIGGTGSGKSASGNRILGKEAFESCCFASSVTSECRGADAVRFGCNLYMVDTPGLFDTNMSTEVVIKEIIKCVGMTSPGPHAFLLVIALDRFTKEKWDTVKEFQKCFGEEMLNHAIVLFTRADDLQGTSIEEFVQGAPKDLMELLRRVNDRYIAFNNRAATRENDHQVQQLLAMIHRMVKLNGGSHYSNEMFAETEKLMKRNEAMIRRDQKLQQEREREEMERIYKMQLMKKEREHAANIRHLEDQIRKLNSKTSDQEQQERRNLALEIKREREMEHYRRVKELEQRQRDLQARLFNAECNWRLLARRSVEKNHNTLDLLLKGLKKIVQGLFQTFKLIF